MVLVTSSTFHGDDRLPALWRRDHRSTDLRPSVFWLGNRAGHSRQPSHPNGFADEPAPYDRQFRDTILAPHSRTHPLGTDDLGRDRLSRLLYGTRVSLVLAPAAALLASLLSGAAGVFAAWKGGLWRNGMEVSSDLFLSLPWMFLLLTVRAALPLNISPLASVALTFLLLGALGWAAPSRVVLTASSLGRWSSS